MSIQIEFRDHPAAARHPVTGAIMRDDSGRHVSLVPEQRGIYLDGKLVGYCGAKPHKPISFIYSERKLPQAIRQKIIDAATERFGPRSNVGVPAAVRLDESGLPEGHAAAESDQE